MGKSDKCHFWPRWNRNQCPDKGKLPARFVRMLRLRESEGT